MAFNGHLDCFYRPKFLRVTDLQRAYGKERFVELHLNIFDYLCGLKR